MSRLTRGIVGALLVAAFLPSFLAVALDLLGSAKVGGVLADAVGLAIFGLFLVGLLVRLRDSLRAGTPRSREQEERRELLAGRFLAEDVPIEGEDQPIADEDPALPFEEEA